MRYVKTSNDGEYEIDCIGSPRRNTAAFSCEDDCLNCNTRCQAGIDMTSILANYDIVGA